MTDEELASQPGGVATRPDEEPTPPRTTLHTEGLSPQPANTLVDPRRRAAAQSRQPSDSQADLGTRCTRPAGVVRAECGNHRPVAAAESGPSSTCRRAGMPLQPPPPGASTPVVEVCRSRRAGRRGRTSRPTIERRLTTTSKNECRPRGVDEEADGRAAPPSRPIRAPRRRSIASRRFPISSTTMTSRRSSCRRSPHPGRDPCRRAPPVLYAPVLAENFYIPPPQRPATTTVATMIVAEGKPRRHEVQRRKQKRQPVADVHDRCAALRPLGRRAPSPPRSTSSTTDVVRRDRSRWPTMSRRPRVCSSRLSVEVTELPVADYAHALGDLGDRRHRRLVRRCGERSACSMANSISTRSDARRSTTAPAFYDPAYEDRSRHRRSQGVRASLPLRPAPRADGGVARPAVRLERAAVSSASPAAALAIRATIDGDALAVANALAAERRARSTCRPSCLAFVQGHGDHTRAIAVRGNHRWSPRRRDAARPLPSMANDPASLAALEQATPSSDVMLDAAARPSADAVGSRHAGDDVLVLRAGQPDRRWPGVVGGHPLDERLADDVGRTPRASASMPRSRAADADGALCCSPRSSRGRLLAPAESTTTVAPIDGNQIAIQRVRSRRRARLRHCR